jgi:2-hydroxy-4-carboxymuconate semialdehyde hemiacetal dehydrogenase
MTMRVAMIGSGSVASIHAAKLSDSPGVELATVYSPDSRKASAFASRHGIKSVKDSVREAIANATAAIICSPSGEHFAQARECLLAGVHTLIELPPCADASQAEELGELAKNGGIQVGCAHTARYLLPYASIQAGLEKIGEILEINYVRYHQLRARSWTDNALLHHAAHPLDLIMNWCGGLSAIGCVARPDSSAAQAVSILGRLPNGGPASIAVSYTSHLPHTRMLIVGSEHTVETDGFSYVNSDLAELRLQAAQQEVYEQAVGKQDLEFLSACTGENAFIDWAETVRLIRAVNQFQALRHDELRPPP